MIKRVRRKFIFIGIIATVVVTILLILAINLFNAVQTDQRLDRVLLEISGNRYHAGESGDKRGKKERHAASTQYAGRVFSVSTDASGTIKAPGNNETREDVLMLSRSVLESGLEKGTMDEYRFLAIHSENETRLYFLDCSTELEGARMLLLISALVGLFGIFVSSLFIILMSGKIVIPLRESMEKQKQFITDAGHELKTPLSVIGMNMDILSMDLGKNEWVEGTRKQVKKLRDLVTHLITLSRLEEAGTELLLTPFCISDAARETAEPFRDMAVFQGREMSLEIEDGLYAAGDEMTIRQMFTILCDNAVKYSVGEEAVCVRLAAEGKYVCFETSNAFDEEKVPADRNLLFDRFYRGDASRSKNREAGGYGLGLSIAKGIAQKNRISLIVSEDKEHHLVFRALFPVIKQPVEGYDGKDLSSR